MMMAPQPRDQVERIEKLVPDKYLTSTFLEPLKEELLQEIDDDYEYSTRKSIGELDDNDSCWQ